MRKKNDDFMNSFTDNINKTEYINKFNSFTISNNIQKYYRLNKENMSDDHLSKILFKTIPFSHARTKLLIGGTKFFRIRKNNNFEPFKNISDVKSPPPEICNMGRLNKKGEAIFYTSLDNKSPFYEARLEKGDYFSLMEYSLKPFHTLNVCAIAYNLEDFLSILDKDKTLTPKGKKSLIKINDFLCSEITLDVNEKNSYFYRVTNAIKEMSFTPPYCQGYFYPSVARKKGYNVAILDFLADLNLAFNSLIYAQFLGFDDLGEPKYDILAVCKGSDSFGKLIYQ